MRLRRTALLALSSLVLGVFLVACGGDKKDTSASYDSGRGGAPPASSVDLSKAAGSIESLKSFRFDLLMKLDLGGSSGTLGEGVGGALGAALLGALGDIRAEGAYVAPDQMDVKLRLFGEELSYVQIGSKAWVKQGSKWEATTPDAASGMSFGSPSDLFDQFLPKEVLRGAKTTKESVNGVSATRYSFDKKAIESLAKDMGEDFDLKDLSEAAFDIWLSDSNIPVKVVMSFAGKDENGNTVSMKFETNLRDINSDQIKIKAPI